jgi:hypothetical protein
VPDVLLGTMIRVFCGRGQELPGMMIRVFCGRGQELPDCSWVR